MPIRVRYQNNSEAECTIRPTPLVSIGLNVLKNGAGEAFGVNYSIVLTGTLLADQGSPYGHDQGGTRYGYLGSPSPVPDLVGPYGAFDSNISHFQAGRPPRQQINVSTASHSLFFKQKVLRALFAQDGQRMEITDINDDEPTIVCYPRLVGEITFTEGIYIDRCDFTITLEADTLLNNNVVVDNEGSYIAFDNAIHPSNTEDTLLASLSGAFISDYNEEWSIEVDDSVGESPNIPRSYRISHNISAVGKTHYSPNDDETVITKLIAWEQARTFVQQRLANSITDYPNVMGQIGQGTIDLVDSYGGYNHVRSEQVGESAGSYNVSENWLISSGSSYENFGLSIGTSIDSPFVSVTLDGNIKGLSSITPSGFGGSANSIGDSAYSNSLLKYNTLTNSGQFGVGSDIYKRANNSVAVQLNSQPRSVALGSNEYTGEVTYNLQFDNRPTNIISGVMSESIIINDTYPGDIFAVIPVIGRPTGPVLNYIGGRTEYKRDVAINLTMDYTDVPYGDTRNPLLLKKPSVVEPTATQMSNLIAELSPAGEPNIRKYFISPPQESWEPKAGIYSFNLSWTYEISK